MSNPSEVEIISPEAQRSAIDRAIVQRLGQQWQTEWLVAYESNDLVRLNKGDLNLDFQADLLGDVTVIERQANPVQVSGRLIAWIILGASLFVALAIASVTGVL